MDVILNFLVPSHPRFLPVVRAAVGELAVLCGLRDEERRGITLAVDEAVANIIRHAYHGDFRRKIELTCRAGSSCLEFTLLDQGDPPDPVRLERHAPDSEALSGRGTHIIRSIMDQVSYERVPRGNQLKLSKQLAVPPAAAEEEQEYGRQHS